MTAHLYEPYADAEEAAKETRELLKRAGRTWSNSPFEIDFEFAEHLGMTPTFEDMAKKVGASDTFGRPPLAAIWLPGGQVAIARELDPATFAGSKIPFKWAVAESIAHWVLHRTIARPSTTALKAAAPTFIVGRSPVTASEIAARHFAAALLVPREPLTEALAELMTSFGLVEPEGSLSHFFREDEEVTVESPKNFVEGMFGFEMVVGALANRFPATVKQLEERLRHLRLWPGSDMYKALLANRR